MSLRDLGRALIWIHLGCFQVASGAFGAALGAQEVGLPGAQHVAGGAASAHGLHGTASRPASALQHQPGRRGQRRGRRERRGVGRHGDGGVCGLHEWQQGQQALSLGLDCSGRALTGHHESSELAPQRCVKSLGGGFASFSCGQSPILALKGLDSAFFIGSWGF